MDPITVAVVDDHPALRAGLRDLFEQEPDMRLLDAVPGERELHALLSQERPDVVVLDYALGRGDGLSACFRIKQRPEPPAVVLYSGYVDGAFAVPACIAQADAIVSKSAPVEVLLDAIRATAVERGTLPHVDPELMEAASSRIGHEDLPVIGMLFARVPVVDIARTLDTSTSEVRSRALRIIGSMQASDRIGGRATAVGAP